MLKIKKILIVGMSPVIGGIETFLIQVFRNIDKEYFSIDFLTFWNKCAYEDELIEGGSTVYHLTRRGKNPIKSYFDQKEFFKSEGKKYDFVWVNLSSSSNILTHKMARKYTSAKIISHCHGTSFESSGGIAHIIHTILSKINFKKFIKCTDYAFACSQKAGEWLFKGQKDFKIIKNAIDIDKFVFNRETRQKIRNEFNIDDNMLVIGHVGRFSEVKNHTFLLDVFREFYKKDNKSVLLLVGTGELEPEIRKKVNSYNLEENVIFAGFRQDVENLYQAFDIFVLPSLSEGFPLSIIEAQVSGLPIVASDNITKEIKLSDTVNFVPIDKGVYCWVDILSDLKYKTNREVILDESLSFKNTIKEITDILKNQEN